MSKVTLRGGGLIITYTGQVFRPLEPDVADVDLLDIAQALSLKCRWTGQCARLYTIAKHSLRVANVAVALAKLQGIKDRAHLQSIHDHGIMHDAHEAYLADLASPIKSLVPGWREIEDKIQNTILDYMGLDHSHGAPFVKQADSMLLWIEYRELFPPKLKIDDLYFGKGGVNLWPTYPKIPHAASIAAALPYDRPRKRLIAAMNNIRKRNGRI